MVVRTGRVNHHAIGWEERLVLVRMRGGQQFMVGGHVLSSLACLVPLLQARERLARIQASIEAYEAQAASQGTPS